MEVELVYQPVSARFADELFQTTTRAVRVFRQYWGAADRSPELIDVRSVTAP